jgi:hypothetical protein
MGVENVTRLLNKKKTLYKCLLDEAISLIQGIDIYGSENLSRIIARRKDYLTEIQKIDADLENHLNDARLERNRSLQQALVEIKSFQKDATGKILELDSMVIALGEERLNSLKVEMAELAHGKTAILGYERTNKRTSANSINNIA